MAKTYTVRWGDTLDGIAREHNTTYQTLAKINNLDIVKKNGKDYVHLAVGQVIKLVDDGSSSGSKQVAGRIVEIRTFGLSVNSDRDMYATWNWTRANTKEYKVEWYDYYDGYWHKHESTVTVKNSEFSASSKATKVKVKIKPVAKTYKNSKGNEVAYWTNVDWVTSSTYAFSENPPKKPTSPPKIKIENTEVTATLDGLGALNSPSIVEFQLFKNGGPVSSTVKVPVGNKISVAAKMTITLGAKYRVRARTIRGALTSAWSDPSEEVATKPFPPEITKCSPGASEGTIDISWTSIDTATGYEIEYANDQSYFANPITGQPVKLTSLTEEQIKSCKATITPSPEMIAQKNLYFRIRAKNDAENLDENNKYSEWSNVSQYNSGDGPKAPTTWSSKSMITVGDVVTLNWTHNSTVSTNSASSTEQSYPKYSHVDLYVDGAKKLIPTIDHGDEKTAEKSYTLNTKAESAEGDSVSDIVCPDGATLQWRVRTAGENGYLGAWSVLRTINIYSNPNLEFYAYDLDDNKMEEGFTLTKLPLRFRGFVNIDQEKQKIIGYHIEIKADKEHQAVNAYGETVTIGKDEVIYSRPFDNVDPGNPNNFEAEISAGDITLANDCTYTVTCTVTMSSGLSATATTTFAAVLAPTSYFIDAEISVDSDNYTATIRPYCTQADGETPVENVRLYVYRREYNGDLTFISGGFDNATKFEHIGGGLYNVSFSNTFVTDPHPALDYARYRIVAIDEHGATMYSDLPPFPVGCKSIILQWGENWNDFDATDSDDEKSSSWSGEMLKLSYNIDISNAYAPDVALVKYIGREHPVDYYGTQRGETATWNAEIKKSDRETVYALHRLAKYMGSVYVREPSGVGYRANVKVSFDEKHLDLTIPVSLSITRVE